MNFLRVDNQAVILVVKSMALKVARVAKVRSEDSEGSEGRIHTSIINIE